jgi:hypothetical protein
MEKDPSLFYLFRKGVVQMKNFTINRKVYKAKEFDFNLVCDLEDEGISLEAMQDKPMSMMRAYFGICAGIGRNAAGEEMQKHIVSGGSFEEMAEAMSDAMEQSDFFRAANKTTEAETAENQSEAE